MKNTVVICFLLAVALFTSCTNKEETTGETVLIAHKLDSTAVKLNPERVVALDYASLENLDALGIKVIGTPKSNLPAHLQKFAKDSGVTDLGAVLEIDFEKLAALKPDVIFISSRMQKNYDELKKIAPTVFMDIDYKDFIGSFSQNLGYFGTIFGKEKEVEAQLAAIEEKVKAAHDKLSVLEGKGLVTMYNEGKISAYGKGSRFGFIHETLGLKEAVVNLEAARHGQSISNEFIQKTNPDYLFIVDRGAVVNKKQADKGEIENALVKQTSAYKNGKIIYLDPEVWYISGGGVASVNAMIDEVVKNF